MTGHNSQRSDGPSSVGVQLGIFLLGLASLAMLVRLVGCDKPNRGVTNPPRTAAETSDDAATILRDMIAAYQAAEAYSDRAQLKLAVTRSGRRTEQTWDCAVQFVRPGQLRVEAYNLQVAADGTSEGGQFMARVEDPETNNIDNQVVSVRAPKTITLDTLAADPILYSQLTGQLQRPPVQLELLLNQKPLAALFEKEAQLALLDDQEIEGAKCHRVEAATSEGKFIFWIDAKDKLLRRLEYPAKSLLAEVAADPLVSEADLSVELTNATFKPNVANLNFMLSVPNDARRVKSFVLPPVLASANLLGKRIPEFELVELSGEKITRESVDGKITALYWYAHHEACEKSTQDFAATIAKLGDAVNAYAVSTEPADVGDKAVRDQLASWKVKLTPARDLKQYHGRVFELAQLPAVTLLDERGRFQWMASGPQAVADLPIAIERLQKGEDLAQLAIANYKQLREQYESLLAGKQPPRMTTIAAATSPGKLKLRQAWKLDGLAEPGSVVAIGDDRLAVVAGPKSVWEVSASGEVAAKHDLELPEGRKISAIRTYRTKNDSLYVAVFAPLQPGVYVFDANWKPLFTYPKEETAPVRDVQFADLNRDDEPEVLIAFADNAGLHGVTLQGERDWVNRAYAPILSLAVAHDRPATRRRALVTGRGGILEVTKREQYAPKLMPGWALAHLFAAQFTDATQAAYLAIGADANGDACVVGISEEFAETWNYPLPSGSFERPVDFVASGKLRTDSKGEWIVGWADGSLHIVSEDGEFDDMFNTGEEIRGVAVARHEEYPLLVVSTANGVIAWRVEN